MDRRSSAVAIVIVFIATTLVAQRRTPPPNTGPGAGFPSTSELTIRIVLENDRPIDAVQMRVQLLSIGGVPVSETFSDSNGDAHFAAITAGNYELRVTGPSIEDASSGTFEITRGDSMHTEFVRVRPRMPNGTAKGSSQGSVSSASLRVPDKARKELDKGNDALKHQELESAKTHFAKAAELFPGYPAANNNLAVVCMKLKDYSCARGALDKAIQADPRSPHALMNMARLKMIEEDFPEAEGLFQRSLAVEKDNPETLTLLADTELLMRKYDDAVLYARKVHAVPHDHYAVAHLIAGEALEAQKKQQEAAAEYELFLKESPDDPEAARAREALTRLNAKATVPPKP